MTTLPAALRRLTDALRCGGSQLSPIDPAKLHWNFQASNIPTNHAQGCCRVPLSWLWSLSIVVAWVSIATALGQPIPQQQHSLDLIEYGTFRESDFCVSELWRLIASQWLHVKFPHMLFNALIIGLVGQSLSARFGALVMISVGVLGGAAGH